MSILPKTAERRKVYLDKAPHPGASRVEPAVDYSSASRSVYNGRERLGSYRLALGRFHAVDRLGRRLGQFDSEIEAQIAIKSAGRA
jgi:hypothetical protein